jgi:Electron transfer DM13
MSAFHAVPARGPRRFALRLAALLLTGAVVVLGVWVAGGVISDDFRTSMALTALWFALSGAAVAVLAWKVRPLRAPVLVGYVLTVAVVGGYLGLTTLRDRTVDERVAVGPPVAAAGFVSAEHDTTGRAAVVAVSGGRVLALTGFETSPGPDLRVRLVPGETTDGGADGAVDLGALKGNRGDQQYAIPAGAEVRDHTVVIWCRAFSAPFGTATLRAS